MISPFFPSEKLVSVLLLLTFPLLQEPGFAPTAPLSPKLQKIAWDLVGSSLFRATERKDVVGSLFPSVKKRPPSQIKKPPLLCLCSK